MTGWNWPPLEETVGFSLASLSSIFVTVDPWPRFAFLAMGARGSDVQKRHVARHAAWTCFWVLGAFASAGSLIFKLFGITLPAFKIARGFASAPARLGDDAKRIVPTLKKPKKTGQRVRPSKISDSLLWGFPCWPDWVRSPR